MNSNLARKLESYSDAAARHQLFFQHGDADGYITLAKKQNGRFIQYHYKPEQLAEQLSDYMGEDIYYSQNSFYRPQRRIENIRQLRSLYVDIDCHTFGYKPDWVLGKLELEYFRQSIPEPNLIIFSGRGLVLIWMIEPVPYKALPLWSAVQNHFMNELKEVGSDPRAIDAARVFRLAGTVNSKSGTMVHVEYRHDYKYTLRDIQFDYLPDLTPQEKPQKAKAGRKKKIVRLFNIYSLYHARILDITRLIELRNYDVTGYRETICFLYRYWMCCFCNDTEEAYRQTLELNNTFTRPLRERELRAATKSAEKAFHAKSDKTANEMAKKMGYPGAGYNISNAKLIKWLDISEDEMRQMSTIIDTKEKRRRDLEQKEKKRREAGVRTWDQKVEDDKRAVLEKADIIRKLLQEDPKLSIRTLAEMSGIPKSTVARLKKMI